MKRHILHSIVSFSLFTAALALWGVAPAQADGMGGSVNTGRISLGGRAAYFDGVDADKGSWYGGAQVRFHMTPVFALEGSTDYRRQHFGNQRVDTFPVQASLLGYLLPHERLSPFVLGGAGWYFTHLKDAPAGVDDTQNRFGWHVGGGLQWFFSPSWSVDATYRYVWVEDVKSRDASLVDKNYNDNGHMVTAALNYHFPVGRP